MFLLHANLSNVYSVCVCVSIVGRGFFLFMLLAKQSFLIGALHQETIVDDNTFFTQTIVMWLSLGWSINSTDEIITDNERLFTFGLNLCPEGSDCTQIALSTDANTP